MVYYASLLMAKYGRRTAFIISGVIGIMGAIFGLLAIYYAYFYLFLLATFILGCATVFNQYYRFAAAEIVEDDLWQKKATTLVISGGILGGIAGPYLAQEGVDLIPSKAYLGNFIYILIIFCLLIMSQLFVFLNKPVKQITKNVHFVKNKSSYPLFLFGTLSCAIGFSLMTLIMNAAPLSMHNHAYPIKENAFLLQLHFMAMYIPSLFFPFILNRIKTHWLILLGNSCFFIGAMMTFFVEQYWGYLFSLILAGFGWAMMFTGGTFYLNRLPAENKYHLQGKSSMFTYLGNLIASFSVGIFLTHTTGWQWINISVIFICVLFLLCYLLIKAKIFKTKI